MAVGTLSPVPWWTIQDQNGNPIPGALVYTYLAGTSTLVATYTDVGLTVPNANPIVCDSAGRCVVFLSPGVSYKFVVQTASGAAVRTQDNISAVPTSSAGVDVVGVAGEPLLANQCVYQSAGLGGGTAGRWYRAEVGFTYSSVTPTIGFVTGPVAAGSTFTIRLQGQQGGFSGLTPGAIYYVGTVGAITSVLPTTNARRVGQADSATVLNIDVAPALDYSTGSWTPILNATTGTASTYNVQFGAYIKVGTLINCFFFLAISNKGTMTGPNVAITGLPFTSTSVLYYTVPLSWSGMATPWANVAGFIAPGTVYITLQGNTAAGTSNTMLVAASDLANAAQFVGNAIYITA